MITPDELANRDQSKEGGDANDAEWMSPEAMSVLVGVSLDRLKQLRYERRVYPFHKIPGTRAVWYHRPTIEAMIREGKVEVRR